jgi:hypothetical protein
MDPRTLVRRPKARRLTLSFLATVMLGLLLAALTPAFGAATTPAPAGAPHPDARELVELRTANSRTYDNPDGTRAVEIRTDAINYRTPEGKWAPIDNRLVSNGASGYRNKANSAHVSLPQLEGQPGSILLHTRFSPPRCGQLDP